MIRAEAWCLQNSGQESGESACPWSKFSLEAIRRTQCNVSTILVLVHSAP
jgi:hypothetical protein